MTTKNSLSTIKLALSKFYLGSQHPSPNVKFFCKFEPQIWLEIITSRDAKSACFEGSKTSCREIIFGIFWPNFGRKRSHHVMDASCRLLSWRFPRKKKNSAFGRLSSLPPMPNPLNNASFLIIVVSPSLSWERKFSPKFFLTEEKNPRVMDVRAIGSWMSAPKRLSFFFSLDFEGLTEAFAPGRPPGYTRGRPRGIRLQNLLFGLLFHFFVPDYDPGASEGSQTWIKRSLGSLIYLPGLLPLCGGRFLACF